MSEELTTQLVMAARITLGALVGYAVGWERERRGSRAGTRTFALVSLGAASFTAVGVHNFPETAEKLIAGVVTGIGFLGAGLIMRGDVGQVHGLTTAASLWAGSSLGVLAGAGEYALAVAVCVLVVCVLEAPKLPGVRRLEDAAVPPPTDRAANESPDAETEW